MAGYVSTRDIDREGSSYGDVLLEGLAPDGGLYVPLELPVYDEAGLRYLERLRYAELATAVKEDLVGDTFYLQQHEKHHLNAYSREVFPDQSDGVITPVTDIGGGLLMQNLSLGPTAAFKDMALQPVAQEMETQLTKTNGFLEILGATSGDTGSAAEAALKGLTRARIFMLSPQSGMSRFQKAQMGLLSGGNVVNLSVDGRFDDCQDIVKEVKSDPEFAEMGAVNSINWARIASQIPYYFAGYFQSIEQKELKIGDQIDFVVPTGNFGNILAGYYAREMGLPIRRLIIATNENRVLHEVVQSGVYRPRIAEVTSSPSMDISVSSNFERLVYAMFDGSPGRTANYMQQLKTDGSVYFQDHGLGDRPLRQLNIHSGTSDHRKRLREIRRVYAESGQVIDPHTADGVSVARQFNTGEVPIVVMATALPVKFEDTIAEAIGKDNVPERPERFVNVEDKGLDADRFVKVPADLDAVKAVIRAKRLGDD